MADTSKSTEAKTDSKAASTELAADADAPGNEHAQEVADTETEQGYRGTEVDQTPNEHYTVQGVLAGKPTPETATDESGK